MQTLIMNYKKFYNELDNTNNSFFYIGKIMNFNMQAFRANFDCNTILFKGMINIDNGSINAKNIIFNSNSIINFGKNFKITGEAVILNEKDFNEVLMYKNSSQVNDFFESKGFKLTNFVEASFNNSIKDLQNNYCEYYNMPQVFGDNLLHSYEPVQFSKFLDFLC